MTREEKIQAVLHQVRRLIMELEHRVPPETFEFEELKKLIKELQDGQ
jgi:hypothetical protein